MALMKESTGSLRVYFFVVGILSLLFNIFGGLLSLAALSLLDLSLAIIYFIFSLVIIYVAINLPRLIVNSPSFILKTLYLWILLGAVNALLYGSVVEFAVVALVAIYLIINVKRLAAQS